MTKELAHRGRGSSRDNADKHRPVPWFKIRTADLPAQDRDLVTQHEDLDFFGPLATQTEHDQLQHLAQEQVPTREDHGSCPLVLDT